VNVPLTFGLTRKRATVLLPDDALDWDEPRRRLVLRHEMAHIVRRDCAKQLLARLIVALYWINPLAWLALRKLHNEQERASDDMVLARGAKASDYAMQLLQIASAPSRLPAAAAVPMARRGYLETRVQAILDPKCDRRPANRRSSVMIFVMLAVVAGALAIVRPVAEAAPVPPRTVHLPDDAVFGNVVEMRIDGDRMGWVDFDNERIIGDAPSPPPPSEPDAMRQWLRDGGIDATCEVTIRFASSAGSVNERGVRLTARLPIAAPEHRNTRSARPVATRRAIRFRRD
jgi:hypothetical protein